MGMVLKGNDQQQGCLMHPDTKHGYSYYPKVIFL